VIQSSGLGFRVLGVGFRDKGRDAVDLLSLGFGV
jgi:hypothetical protein